MRTIAVFLCLLLVAPIAAASIGERYVTGGEPDFLEDIGPRGERVDNPFAALIVAIAVLAVVGNGLHRHTKRRRSD